MGQRSNGSAPVPLAVLVVALFGGLSAVVLGMPGPRAERGIRGHELVEQHLVVLDVGDVVLDVGLLDVIVVERRDLRRLRALRRDGARPLGRAVRGLPGPDRTLVPPGHEQVWEGGVTPVVPQVACACGCGMPTGLTCAASASLVAGTSCSAGVPACTAVPLVEQMCATLTGDISCSPAGAGSIGLLAKPMGGMCAPSPPVAVPPATWTTSYVACEPSAAPAPCDGGVCAPNSAGGSFKLCVSTTSAVSACPAPYAMMTTIFTQLDDTRACSACTCGPPGAKCEGGVAELSFGPQCSGANSSTVDVPSCTLTNVVTGLSASLLLTTAPTPSDGMCIPSTGTLTGGVTADEPTTICCM